MNLRKILILFIFVGLSAAASADVDPTVTYMEKNQEVTVWGDFSAEAPLPIHLAANPSNMEPGTTLEWHIRNKTSDTNITRYEETTDYVISESGQTVITLDIKQDDMVVYTTSITITISESHLEMPNAFSPNGDNINDKYGAKGVNNPDSPGRYKSIIEFHAYIFNRWGQKLYEWNDVAGWWDGTYNGRPVKDGTYFVLVKARGADGIVYNIRRDVNLLRRFNQAENTNE